VYCKAPSVVAYNALGHAAYFGHTASKQCVAQTPGAEDADRISGVVSMAKMCLNDRLDTKK
jgi:hypothetical protein